jgi:hypothetical protein
MHPPASCGDRLGRRVQFLTQNHAVSADCLNSGSLLAFGPIVLGLLSQFSS